MTSIRTITHPTLSYPLSRGLKHPLFGSNPKLDAFQCLTEDKSFELQKYGPLDLQVAYDDLSPKARQYIDRELLPTITFEELAELKQQKLLGPLEETADCLFEMYTLAAIRRGIFTPEKVRHLMDRVEGARHTPQAFSKLLDETKKEFSRDEVNALQSVTGIETEKEARTMLALMGLKFASFKLEKPDFDIEATTRTQLLSEAHELVDSLPRLSPKRAMVLAACWLYANSDCVPLFITRQAPEWFLQKTLKLPVTAGDLNYYSKLKQLRRQEVHYLHPDFSYNKRKSKVKFFEVLQEGALLKRAILRAKGTNPEAA